MLRRRTILCISVMHMRLSRAVGRRWTSESRLSIPCHVVGGQALDIARRTTIARVKKCCQIMGRLENRLTAAQVTSQVR